MKTYVCDRSPEWVYVTKMEATAMASLVVKCEKRSDATFLTLLADLNGLPKAYFANKYRQYTQYVKAISNGRQVYPPTWHRGCSRQVLSLYSHVKWELFPTVGNYVVADVKKYVSQHPLSVAELFHVWPDRAHFKEVAIRSGGDPSGLTTVPADVKKRLNLIYDMVPKLPADIAKMLDIADKESDVPHDLPKEHRGKSTTLAHILGCAYNTMHDVLTKQDYKCRRYIYNRLLANMDSFTLFLEEAGIQNQMRPTPTSVSTPYGMVKTLWQHQQAELIDSLNSDSSADVDIDAGCQNTPVTITLPADRATAPITLPADRATAAATMTTATEKTSLPKPAFSEKEKEREHWRMHNTLAVNATTCKEAITKLSALVTQIVHIMNMPEDPAYRQCVATCVRMLPEAQALVEAIGKE